MLKISLLLIFLLHGLRLFILRGQSAPSARDALLDVLVWGTHMPIDPGAYSGELRAEVERHLSRANAYRSTTTPPAFAEGEMVHAAQVSYERRLAAISALLPRRRLLSHTLKTSGHVTNGKVSTIVQNARRNSRTDIWWHMQTGLSAHTCLCSLHIAGCVRQKHMNMKNAQQTLKRADNCTNKGS